jgi:hypothetical protein
LKRGKGQGLIDRSEVFIFPCSPAKVSAIAGLTACRHASPNRFHLDENRYVMVYMPGDGMHRPSFCCLSALHASLSVHFEQQISHTHTLDGAARRLMTPHTCKVVRLLVWEQLLLSCSRELLRLGLQLSRRAFRKKALRLESLGNVGVLSRKGENTEIKSSEQP